MCSVASMPCQLPALPRPAPARSSAPQTAAFSLVELLVVVAIMAILSSLLLVSVSGTKSSRDLANAAYSIQGSLEQARTYAMAENTYTWVGFFEENPASPGPAGTGQVVIAIVASSSGSNLVTGTNAPQLPSSGLIQVAKLTKIPNVHLDVVPSAAVTRPTIATVSPADTYQLGSPDFPNPASPNSWQFLYPLTAASAGAAQYTFTQIIQFSPQGDATRIGDTPTTLMEVGLQPSHGNTVSAGTNFAVLQVTGIGGQVLTYRP